MLRESSSRRPLASAKGWKPIRAAAWRRWAPGARYRKRPSSFWREIRLLSTRWCRASPQRDTQEGIHFGDEAAGVGGVHERFGRGVQGATGGRVDSLDGPQAVLVEPCGRGLGEIVTKVGKTGEVQDEC